MRPLFERVDSAEMRERYPVIVDLPEAGDRRVYSVR